MSDSNSQPSSSSPQQFFPDPMPQEPLLFNERIEHIKPIASKPNPPREQHIVPPAAPQVPKATFTLPPKPPTHTEVHLPPMPQVHVSEKSQNIMLIFAGIGAIVLAILTAFGVNQLLQKKGTPPVQKMPAKIVTRPLSVTPSSIPHVSEFVVAHPGNGTVIATPQATLEGTTSFPSTVVAYTNTNIVSTKNKEDGAFSLSLPLTPGINKVTVASFDQKDQKQEKTIYVIYDTTQSGQSTKVFIGKVISTAGNSLTVAELDTNRQVQVTVNAQTKVSKNGKNATLKDIAVNTIVAISSGQPPSSDTLIPTGLSVYDGVGEQQAVIGQVTGVNNGIMTVLQKTPQEKYLSVIPSQQASVTDASGKTLVLTSITKGNTVLVLGIMKEFDEVTPLDIVVLHE